MEYITVCHKPWKKFVYQSTLLRFVNNNVVGNRFSWLYCTNRALSDIQSQRSCRPPPRPPKTRASTPEIPACKRPRSSPSFHALGMCACDRIHGKEILSPTMEDMVILAQNPLFTTDFYKIQSNNKSVNIINMNKNKLINFC